MKAGILVVLLTMTIASAWAQNPSAISPFDGAYWGVVLEDPGTKDVTVTSNIEYRSIPGQRSLKMDIYLPPDVKSNETRPAIVLLNGLGDQPNDRSSKSSASYTSWAKLIAANGFVAVTMETEVNRVKESFKSFFQYIADQGTKYHIDPSKIGTQSFSAHGRESCAYIMSSDAFVGIKAAVMFYAERPPGPYRDDLPLLFIISELDIRNENYSTLWAEVLRTNAPWTISLAHDMPHAFDVFSDTETSRRLIMQTLSFWKNQLGDVQKSSLPPSKERAIVEARYDRDQGKVLRLMRDWMKENPNSTDAYALSEFGSALMNNKEYLEAEKYLRRAIAIEPKNKGNYLNLAVVSYALNKTREAEESLARYEEGSIPEAFTYAYIATRMLAIGKYELAAKLFEGALAFPSPAGYMYYFLGCCYAKLNVTDRAFNNLFSAASLGFGSKESYERDENLKSLQNDKRWKELMDKLQ